jgi:hypothetical protein
MQYDGMITLVSVGLFSVEILKAQQSEISYRCCQISFGSNDQLNSKFYRLFIHRQHFLSKTTST